MAGQVSAAVGEDIALGLSLAGVKDIFMFGGNHSSGRLKEWFKARVGEGGALVILSPEAASELRKEMFDKRSQGILLPVVVIIPGEGGDLIAQELIRRAVGMLPGEDG